MDAYYSIIHVLQLKKIKKHKLILKTKIQFALNMSILGEPKQKDRLTWVKMGLKRFCWL